MAYIFNPLLRQNLQKLIKSFKNGNTVLKINEDGIETNGKVEVQDIILTGLDKASLSQLLIQIQRQLGITVSFKGDATISELKSIIPDVNDVYNVLDSGVLEFINAQGTAKSIIINKGDNIIFTDAGEWDKFAELPNLDNKQDKLTEGDGITLKNNIVKFVGISNPDNDNSVTITRNAQGEFLLSVKEQLSKLYRFKGSLNTYEELLAVEDKQIGDCYNVNSEVHRLDGGTYNNAKIIDKSNTYSITLSLFKESETSYVIRILSDESLGGFGAFPFYIAGQTHYMTEGSEFISISSEEHQLMARVQSDSKLYFNNYMQVYINGVARDFEIVENVTFADNKETILAGTNFSWDGSSWDALGGRIDLSVIVPKAILESTVESEFDKIFN